MKIDILTLFPNMFDGFINESIIKRAISKGVIDINIIDIRPFSDDKNKKIDDYPLGGGAGMVMKCQPVLDCLKTIKKENSLVILMSPRGEKYNQQIAHDLSTNYEHLIFICGKINYICDFRKEYFETWVFSKKYLELTATDKSKKSIKR